MQYTNTIYVRNPANSSAFTGADVELKQVDDAGSLVGGGVVVQGTEQGTTGVYEFLNSPLLKYKLYVNETVDITWGGAKGKFFPEITSLKTISNLDTDTPDKLGQIGIYTGKYYIAVSLTGTMWVSLLTVAVDSTTYAIQNAYTPIDVYKHVRGDAEYIGDSAYSAKGLMLYEQMTERVFRAVKLKSYVSTSAAITVKIAVVSTKPIGPFAIPEGDVVFTKTYAAGEWNPDSSAYMTIDLGTTVIVPDNYYVLVFMSCLSSSTLYIRMWGTEYGSAPERHEFGLTNASDPIAAANWALSSPPAYAAVPLLLLSDTGVRLGEKYTTPIQDAFLPAKMFAAVDRQFLIWWKNLVDTKDSLSRYTFDVTCAKGKNFEDYFAYTPGSGEVGLYPITIVVRDEYGTVVKTLVSSIEVVAKNAGSGTKKILCIGDSTMRGTGSSTDTIPSELAALVTADGGITGTFIGVRPSNGTLCEGIPGFTIGDFTSNPGNRPTWKFTVSGITVSPVPDLSEYTNNSSTFICRHIKISAGSGYIVMERKSGSNAPLASGTLTKTENVGDATISFSAIAAASANPFYDVANSRVSMQYYCTEFGFAGIDVAVLSLGINDLISTSVYSSMTTYINNLKTIIDNINHATYGYPSAKIIINLQPPCGDTVNGLATDYNNAFSVYAYKKNMRNFWREVIASLETVVYNPNVFIAIGGLMIDRDAGYPKTTGNRTARDTTQVSTHSNGVHPNPLGNKYLADAIYPAMRKSIT